MDSDYQHDESAGAASVDDIFRHLYARAGSGSAEITRLIALLDAVKETVAEALLAEAAASAQAAAASGKGKKAAVAAPTPSAYFGALLTALERTGLTHARDIFYLQSLLLPHVPAALVRSRYEVVGTLFAAALEAPAVISDAPTLRALLSCVGHTLRALEPSAEAWSRPAAVRPLSALIAFSADERAKVRKAAQGGVTALLAAQHASRGATGAARPIASALCAQLTLASTADHTRVARLLPLARTALPLLPVAQIAEVADRVLRLLSCGVPRLAALAYALLAALLEAPAARLSVSFVTATLNALLGAAPSPDDAASCVEFAYACAAGVARLASMERLRHGASPAVDLSFLRGLGAAAGALTRRRAELADGGDGGGDGDSDGAAGDEFAVGACASIAEAVPRVVAALVGLFASYVQPAQHAAANALATVLTVIGDAGTVRAAAEWIAAAGGAAASRGAGGAALARAGRPAPLLVQVTVALEGLLTVRYQHSWPVSLPVLAVLFRLAAVADAAPSVAATPAAAAGAAGAAAAAAAHDGSVTPAANLLAATTLQLMTLRDLLSAAVTADGGDDEDSEDEDADGSDSDDGGRKAKRARRRGGDDDAGSSDDDAPSGGKRRGPKRSAGGRGRGNSAWRGKGGSSGGAGGGGGGYNRRAGGSSGNTKSLRLAYTLLGLAIRGMGAPAFTALCRGSNRDFTVPLSLTGAAAASASAAAGGSAAVAVAAAAAAPEDPDAVCRGAWAVPLLRDHAAHHPAPLSFVTAVVMPAVRKYETASAASAGAGLVRTARAQRAMAAQLWALLPSLLLAGNPDFSSGGFSVPLAKALTQAAGDRRFPELTAIVSRALSIAIERCTASAHVHAAAAAGAGGKGDAEDDDDASSAGGSDGGSGDGGSDSDDSDDSDAGGGGARKHGRGVAGARGAGAGGRGGGDGGDGASTVFGAGGVSVYGGATEVAGGSGGPRHALLTQALTLHRAVMPRRSAADAADAEAAAAAAIGAVDDDHEEEAAAGGVAAGGKGGAAKRAPRGEQVMPLSQELAASGLALLRSYAPNVLPVLFNAYESLAATAPAPAGAAPGAPGADASAPAAPQLSEANRTQMGALLLDVIGRYAAIVDATLLEGLLGRTLRLLASATAALAEADMAVKRAKSAAASASSVSPTAPAAVAANAAVQTAKKAAEGVTKRLASLLSLSLSLAPALGNGNAAGAAGAPTPAPTAAAAALVQQLHRAIEPALADSSHARVQKLAYAVLASLLKHHGRVYLVGPEFEDHREDYDGGAAAAGGKGKGKGSKMAGAAAGAADAAAAAELAAAGARRDTLVASLRDSLLTVTAAARRLRLRCLRLLIGVLSPLNPTHMALVPSLLGEVMLCSKDANGKVRSSAFALLLAMARKMRQGGGDGNGIADWGEDAAAAAEADDDDDDDGGADGSDDDEDGGSDDDSEGSGIDMATDSAGKVVTASRGAAKAAGNAGKGKKKGGKKAAMDSDDEDDEDDDGDAAAAAAAAAGADGAALAIAMAPTAVTLTEFFRMILGGLAASTPHMRSASLRCLARLLYAFGDSAAVHSLVPALLRTALLLMREKSREVVVSVVGFVKVCISCLPPASLQPHLPRIVKALLLWSGDRKERLKARVRNVLGRLVRRFGFAAVQPLVPAGDAPLLAHMRKEALRREKKRLLLAAAAAGDSAAAAGVAAAGAARGRASAVTGARTSFNRLIGDEDDDDDDDDGGALGGHHDAAWLDDIDPAAAAAAADAAEAAGAARSVAGSAMTGAGAAGGARSVATARSWGVLGSRITAAAAAAAVGGVSRAAAMWAPPAPPGSVAGSAAAGAAGGAAASSGGGGSGGLAAALGLLGGSGAGGGGHMARVTTDMRSGSASLTAAAASSALPPVGAITEGVLSFAGKGAKKATRLAAAALAHAASQGAGVTGTSLIPGAGGSVVGGGAGSVASKALSRALTKMPGGAGAGAGGMSGGASVMSKRAAKRAAADAAGGYESTLLRDGGGGGAFGDADAPMDLMDPSLGRALIGADPLSLAAFRARQAADAARRRGGKGGAGGSVLPAGMRLGADGRLVIEDDGDSDTDAAGKGKKAAGAGAGKAGGKGKAAGGAGGMAADGDGDGDSDGVDRIEDDDLDLAAAKAGRSKREQARRVRWKEDAEADADGKGGKGGRGSSKGPLPAGAQGWGMRKGKDGKGGGVPGAAGGAGGGRFSGAQFRGAGGTGGDVKRKTDKFEPFAYVPLTGKGGADGSAAQGPGRYSHVVASTTHSARTERKRGSGGGGAAGGAGLDDIRQMTGLKRKRGM